MDYCEDHDLPLESVHCETGPGVWEAAIGVDDFVEMLSGNAPGGE